MEGRRMIDLNEDSSYAEQSVIGSLMHLSDPNSELMIKAMGMLKESSFYKQYHRQIFKGIKALFAKNESIDLLTVESQCKKQGNNDADLFVYLASSIQNTPSASNIIAYAKMVREYSIERFTTQKIQELLGTFNDRVFW